MTDRTPHHIVIPANERHPALDAQFGRVTVLLGANGTGKSALIASLRSRGHAPFGMKHAQKIEARRVMNLIGRSQLTRAQAANAMHSLSEGFLENYNFDTKWHQNEFSKLLEALCTAEQERDTRYSKECNELALSGKRDALAPRPRSALDDFKEIYTDALPDLTLEFDTASAGLACRRRGGQAYGPENMSSGEQQVFLLLGKFISARPETAYFIDEPELNLNPRLAERFWSIMERRNPSSVFVYATHALHFAMRPEVDRALVLGRKGVVPLDASEEFLALAREDREQFLGSIPSIVLASKVLFTEGEPDSIDTALYSYLLQGTDIRVESVGGCEEVEKAVAGRQGWERFTVDAQVGGVIDSDFKSDEEVARLAKLRAYVLPYHEAESVLCHPTAVAALSSKVHPEGRQVTAAAALDAVVARLAARRIEIALTRAASRTPASVRPAVPAPTAARITLDADAHDAFRASVQACLASLSAVDPRAALDAELHRIDAATSSRDVDAVLKLMPGKALTQQIRSLLGLRGTDQDLLAYYQKHFPKADLPCFTQIRERLVALFA